MKSRLHFVLTLLTACIVLCADSQAAVCELACGLGRNVPCHGSAPTRATSNDVGMDGMEHMHCSGMMHGLKNSKLKLDAQVGSRDGGKCTHSSLFAVIDSSSSIDSFTQMHWVLIETVISRDGTSLYRDGTGSKGPPLQSPINPLLVNLRV